MSEDYSGVDDTSVTEEPPVEFETVSLNDELAAPDQYETLLTDTDTAGNEYTYIDTDGDGAVDYSSVDSNADGIAETVWADTDGDGLNETVATDTDGDGLLDRAEIDEDGDGVADFTITDTDFNGTLESVTSEVTVNLEDPESVAAATTTTPADPYANA